MNNWGNDLISTPAASRQGTAQTTPRPSAPPSALRNKSNKQQVLPAVAAALKKDKAKEAGISFNDEHARFDPDSTRVLAARHAKSVKHVAVDKIISVTGEDVTDARRPKPRSTRRRTGVLVSAASGARSELMSPLRDRGITFGDQYDGGSLVTERKYKPSASAAHRYRKPSGDTPPRSPANWDRASPPPPPDFAPRSWRVKNKQRAGEDGFAVIERMVRQEGQRAVQQVEHHVVSQMTKARANLVRMEREQGRLQASLAKKELLDEHSRSFQIGRMEQEIASIYRKNLQNPPPQVAQHHRAKALASKTQISSEKGRLQADKAAGVLERKAEVERGRIVVAKTEEARQDYFRRMQEELNIQHSGVSGRLGA